VGFVRCQLTTWEQSLGLCCSESPHGLILSGVPTNDKGRVH